MPYVRTHGNQIAIVHGERDKSTGKVNQRKLFTFYSKVEAAAAIGENNKEDTRYFQRLLQEANPGIKFNWDTLGKEIREKMQELPDLYPTRQARSEDAFKKALDDFVRQLLLMDPQHSPAGRVTLNEFKEDLSTLTQFIDMRLEQHSWNSCEDMNESTPFDDYDPFCWRNEVQGPQVPDDAEEQATEFYRAGHLAEAKQQFKLLVRCFPNFAEGYNYLGLIALQENELKQAIEYFQTTMKTGRTLFPKRAPKSSYWRDHSTRPFMRGLLNLTLALIRAERYKEALELCDQLYRECGDKGKFEADAYRAAIYLNLHNWQASLDAASQLLAVFPGEGFIASYASFELGQHRDAVEFFLYGALNRPQTACILLDRKRPKPDSSSAVDDHNGGIELCLLLPRFLQMQSKQSRRFFKKLGENEEVRKLIETAHQCTMNHSELKDQSARKANFALWHKIQAREFAAEKAREIFPLAFKG